jgi:hypothetical protein
MHSYACRTRSSASAASLPPLLRSACRMRKTKSPAGSCVTPTVVSAFAAVSVAGHGDTESHRRVCRCKASHSSKPLVCRLCSAAPLTAHSSILRIGLPTRASTLQCGEGRAAMHATCAPCSAPCLWPLFAERVVEQIWRPCGRLKRCGHCHPIRM